MLLLSAGSGPGPRRDLVERVAAVRSGERPPPVSIPRLGLILRDTDGVPFFQEQMVAMIESLAGRPRGNAEALFQDLREGVGPKLARERALFVRQAADRGVSPRVAAKVFSLLLTLAPHAPCAGDLLPYAQRISLLASRKSLDPGAFAAESLNGLLDARRRLLYLLDGFRREGIRFLPLDRNASGYDFRLEGEAVRVGLAIVPGMTREVGDLFVGERERGGPFGTDANMIGRLASCRFPRTVLDELARSLCGKGISPELSVVAREGALPRPHSPSAPSVRVERRVVSRAERPRRGGAQTSFAFFGARRPWKGRRERARKSSDEREER
jgi:DNA polymerase-3 subunit alpha